MERKQGLVCLSGNKATHQTSKNTKMCWEWYEKNYLNWKIMACLSFIFFASFKRRFRQLCTHTESKYNCSRSWWFSQQRWHISGRQTLMRIRIMGKSRALPCTAFFMHTLHPHNQPPQSPCWIMNSKMKRKLRSSKQRREDSSWHLQWGEVPSGCSRWLQLFWPDYLARTELQWGKHKGTGRRKGTKGKKTSTENEIWSLQAT